MNKISLAAAVGIGLTASSAHAALQFLDGESISGAGIGKENTILTIQAHGNGVTESGSVVADGSRQKVEGDAKTGQSQTQLRTLSELGLNSASDLRIVFNVDEPAHNSITLDNLIVTIYDPSGAVLFTSGDLKDKPVSFPDTFAGVGNAGFVFGLDSTQAADAQTKAFTGNFGGNRIGLFASASEVAGGPETFFAAAIPEPGTLTVVVGGILALLGIGRRRL